jgi:DNA-binding CsgD family transcriptional regulator
MVRTVRGVAWLLDEPPDPLAFVAPGWMVQPLGDDAGDGRRTLLVGAVVDARSAGSALGAAARGTAVAVHLAFSGTARQRFLEDLTRLGVEVRDGVPEPPRPSAAQVELLELLAAGSTVTAAAAKLHISRRTSNRMLGEVRDLFGVESNAQAVKVWVASRPERC